MHSHASFIQLPIVSGIAFVSGLVMFVRGFRVWRERRLIQNTPSSHIRSMAMGLVEINGVVEPRSTLMAPFSNHPCVFWEVDISTLGRNGWRVVHRNMSGHPFFISDGTAAALVYPQGAECKLIPGIEEVCNGPVLPPCYAEYLKEQSLPLLSVMSVGQMRFRERVIEDGQRAFVLGTAMPRPHAVELSDGDAMQGTGTDGRPTRLAALDQATVGVVRRGENERTFIISQESERALALDLGIQSMAQLIGGPLLSLGALGWWLFGGLMGRGFH
ncbi:MAG TPA: GIDE domain-containing protein [Candidatus Udaeobacter sp.]|jgi:hypothetical protein|nr:GIDE domain-containing protein [Candidatus Udaeobacter sp.]